MNYPPEVLILAKIAKPLGDPARMKILRYLYEHGDTSLPNLREFLRLHPKKVDEHLRLLKRSNLVNFYPGPRDRIYILNENEFRRHMRIIGEFLASLRSPGSNREFGTAESEEQSRA